MLDGHAQWRKFENMQSRMDLKNYDANSLVFWW